MGKRRFLPHLRNLIRKNQNVISPSLVRYIKKVESVRVQLVEDARIYESCMKRKIDIVMFAFLNPKFKM